MDFCTSLLIAEIRSQKIQMPNYKSQTNSNNQNSKYQTEIIEIWNLGFI